MRLDPTHMVELEEGKRALLRAFGTSPGLTAFAYGFRRRAGRLTDEPAVIASVAEKREAGYVSRSSLLPRTVEVNGRRYGVDVIQAGPFSLGGAVAPRPATRSARAGVTDPIPERMRPAHQGCLITNVDTNRSATFGCLVRDPRSSNAPSILTSGHALGSIQQPNGASHGDSIYQPNQEDGDSIGVLSRFSMLHEDRPNRVDAAVVHAGGDCDTLVARRLMPPIQPSHPILGILIANASDGSSLFSPIENVLEEMVVDFWGNESSVICNNIDFDMNVDKVGAASGYTSSIIVGMGVTPVNLGSGNSDRYFMFNDLVQVDKGFARSGDAGAAVCLGGDGFTRIPSGQVPCIPLENMEEVTGLPFTQDNVLGDTFRDDFLILSKVGRLLVRLFYVNFKAVGDRIAQVSLNDSEKDQVGALYDKYRQIAQNALSTPNSPGHVVTDEHINDAAEILYYLTYGERKPWITEVELDAAWRLLEIFSRTSGMNRQQLVAMMNDETIYREVYDILARVPAIHHLGTFGADR